MRFTILAVLVLACIASVKLTPAGVAAAIDNTLISNTKNYVAPLVLKVLNNVSVPQIDFD